MRKLFLSAAVTVLALWPVLAGAQGSPAVSFTSPSGGSTVTGPRVEVKLKVDNFKLVAAGTAVAAGEGHGHIFVDREPTKAGENIPTDQPNIIHMGAAPFDTRNVENLSAGKHTLHAVLADSAHKTLTPVVSSKIDFTVSAAGQASPPVRPADTGDGSLATEGVIGFGGVAALALAAAAVVGRKVVRS